MSRFYANIEGQSKTQATRQGSKKSGIRGHIRGWNLGIEVSGYPTIEGSDLDSFNIYITGGSKNPFGDLVIVVNERPNDKPEVIVKTKNVSCPIVD